MAFVMLITGLILEVPNATRDQVLQPLGGATGIATGQVNGVTTTIRASAVIAVSDSIEGLRPTMISPKPGGAVE